MSTILALVTARGGSKGLPGKNILPLAGRPLIGWTIEAARDSGRLDRIILSTDDPAIVEVARSHGAEAPFLRPTELARDDSPHIDAVLHALQWLDRHDGYRPDFVLLLQPTSPLRTSRDIGAAIAMAESGAADSVVGVTQTHDHPYLARRMSSDGLLFPFVPCDIDYPRRQDLSPAYAVNGAIYLNRRERLLATRSFESGRAVGYEMPAERSLQIDTAWDFHLCDLVLRHRLAQSASAVGG